MTADLGKLEAQIDTLADNVALKKLDGLLFQSTAISYDDKSADLLNTSKPCPRREISFRSNTRKKETSLEKGTKSPIRLLLTELSAVSQTLNNVETSLELTSRAKTSSHEKRGFKTQNNFYVPRLMFVTPRTETNKTIIDSFRKLHKKYRVVQGEEKNLHDFYTGLMRKAKSAHKRTAYQYPND